MSRKTWGSVIFETTIRPRPTKAANPPPMRHGGVVFLDRDGTMNRNDGYVHTWDAWVWLPGVPEALARLQRHGWRLVVVSNQSGIARGYFDEKALHDLEAAVDADLARHGVRIAGWYHCPHLPEITGPCTCRKPEPGMLRQAARDLGINLRASWVIGDKYLDAQAGIKVGCRAIILEPEGLDVPRYPDTMQYVKFRGMRGVSRVPYAPDMATACEWILQDDVRKARHERFIRRGRRGGPDARNPKDAQDARAQDAKDENAP
ncbi:MAG: HAD family hydrolase [Desulfovibrio sp.]|jgi:D-glycero-D-manno-heptose 1,7-bisphosphate phosphatase|nr:HAD family hydrolase [Desulfovibrio sp.]